MTGSKGKKYADDEHTNLANAYVTVSHEGQKSIVRDEKIFWNDLYDCFNVKMAQHNASFEVRPLESLKKNARIILASCKLFDQAIQRAERHAGSGANNEDVQRLEENLYRKDAEDDNKRNMSPFPFKNF